jgi:hypothetical protein
MAITHRSTLLKAFLCGMIKLGTPKPIMDTLEYKLSLTLNLQYSPSYWNRTPSSYSISPMHIRFVLYNFGFGVSLVLRTPQYQRYARRTANLLLRIASTIYYPQLNIFLHGTIDQQHAIDYAAL